MSLFKSLPPNELGQDYFVGDIHGHYDHLMLSLQQHNFDQTRDRLISVGDLIDRGPDSERCIQLLHEPWFHACLGNHEWMMIGAFLFQDSVDLQMQRSNGGAWLDNHEQEQLQNWAALLKDSCPLAIEVSYKGLSIGVTHNQVLNDDWKCMYEATAKQIDRCVWQRDRFRAALEGADLVDPVRHVNAVVSGHNAYSKVVRAANQLFIDTVWMSGKLTLMSAAEVLRMVGAASS